MHKTQNKVNKKELLMKNSLAMFWSCGSCWQFRYFLLYFWQMSKNRLKKIFTKTMYKLAEETNIPMSILYRHNDCLPKGINTELIKKLAKHADMTAREFLKRYMG
jgi:hypothetical protein